MTNKINEPTLEEIEMMLNYFKMSDEKIAYDLYLKSLVEKHGERWVEKALTNVITMLSLKK